MSKLEVDAIEPQSGTTLTIGASGDTITIPSGATLTNSGTLGAGMGKVLQVVSFATASGTNTTSTSFVDTALTASITPSSTSNKVFIIVSQNAEMGVGSSGYITLDRNGTNLSNSTGFAVVQLASYSMPCGISYLDSPSSTSALTYKVQIRSGDGTSFSHNSQNPKASITLMEISA